MYEFITCTFLSDSLFNLGPESQIITVLILLFSVTLFQLLDARSEYFSPIFIQGRGTEDYHVHHDEKLIVPDARFFFLKRKGNIDISDFVTYPISGAYGIAGPTLAYLGFKIFGMNNLGLRFFFILITTATNLFCVLSLLNVSPGLIGIIFSIAYILNYNSFVINRLAIVEHILTLFLTGILLLYLSNTDFFLHNIHWLGFVAAISILAKPNFVINVYIPIFVIAFIEKLGFPGIRKLFLYSIGGVIFFEGIQMLILYKLGIARGRYYTVLRGIKQISGTGKWIALTGHLQSVGRKVFLKYIFNFAEWYGSKPLIKTPKKGIQIAKGLLFLILLICGLMFGVHHTIPRSGWVIITFIGIYLISLSPFYYYLKRAFSIFPLTIILLAIISHILFREFLTVFPDGSGVIVILLSLIAVIYIAFQLLTIVNLPALRSHGVEKNSASLDNDLPKGSVVYTHCLGYRFFWQAKKQRLMSGDDTIMSNQMIVNWAIENRAKYVILSYRENWNTGGPIEPETTGLLRPIKFYKTIPTESDVQETFILCELII